MLCISWPIINFVKIIDGTLHCPESYHSWTLLCNWSHKVNHLNEPLERNQGFTPPSKVEATSTGSSLFSCLHMCTGKASGINPNCGTWTVMSRVVCGGKICSRLCLGTRQFSVAEANGLAVWTGCFLSPLSLYFTAALLWRSSKPWVREDIN